MNVPFRLSGARTEEEPAGPHDPGCKGGVFLGTLLTLAVLLAGPPAAWAAKLANHMDYPVEAFSLWCQDPHQQWVERKLSGHLDMEQQVSVTLPEEPCFFLEADMGDYLLSFPVKQELRPEDRLDTSCMPDPTLEVFRGSEPLFIADGEEKDRDLARDPDRNPPETVSIGPLLDTFRGDMDEAACLRYGILLRRESYNDSQNISLKTSLSSGGVLWQGVISLYRDTESSIVGLSLTSPLSEGTLHRLFGELAAKDYKHAMLGDEGPVYADDPILSDDPGVRAQAVRDTLSQLAAPNADPYDAHFEPDTPECREKKEGTSCLDLGVDIRIAPGSNRIELFLQDGEESPE